MPGGAVPQSPVDGDANAVVLQFSWLIVATFEIFVCFVLSRALSHGSSVNLVDPIITKQFY